MFNMENEVQKFCLSDGERHLALNAEIDPDSALKIVEKYNYKQQRAYSPKHVSVLAEAIKRSQFREFTPIDFAVLNGVPHLVNGQHTLRAIAESGHSIWLSIHLHKVESEQEVEKLYSKYDIGRTRSIRDTMGNIGEEIGIGAKERDSLAVAATFINNGFRHYWGSDDASVVYESRAFEFRKELMRDWAKEAKIYFGCMEKAPNSNKALFLRGLIVAVGLVTVRHQEEKAIQFWSGAALDDGLRIGDPRKGLISWLRDNPVGKSQMLQHRAAISCWNAWQEDRSLKKVYTDTSKSMSINGTNVEIKVGGKAKIISEVSSIDLKSNMALFA